MVGWMDDKLMSLQHQIKPSRQRTRGGRKWGRSIPSGGRGGLKAKHPPPYFWIEKYVKCPLLSVDSSHKVPPGSSAPPPQKKFRAFHQYWKLLFSSLSFHFLRGWWAVPGGTARPGQPVAKVEQAPNTSPKSKNQFNIIVALSHVSDIKLIRTDTTLWS